MKNILKIFIVAIMATVVFAMAANATPIITYDVVETETEGLYQIVATVSNDEGDFRVFANTISFDFSIINPSNYKGKATAIETSVNSKAPLTVYTYTTTTYDPDLDEDVETTVTADYTQAPVWTVDGDRASLVFETYKAPADLPTNGMAVFKMYFVLADGKTFEDFTTTTFTVETIDWTSGTNLYFYGQDEDGYETNLTVVNNVVPEASAITITVAEGDKVYLGSTVLAEITAETAGEYDVTEYAGKYVTVNTGYTAQKTYYIGTSATLVHENGVVSVNEQGIRGPKATDEADYGEDRSGLRFKMNHGTAGRTVENHEIVEVGFVMTAESTKIITNVGENYVLDMDMVGNGYAAYGYAYNPTAGRDFAYDSSDDLNYIITGVFYNIPLTQAGVQTTIASRPYYKVGDTYVYGEITKTTLYDKAAAIKADTETFEALDADQQDYINNIVGLVEGWAEIVEEEVIIDVSGLYA